MAVQYVDFIKAKQYDEVGGLWADDALFRTPTGIELHGRAAITQFYSTFLRKITPIIRIASLTEDTIKGSCAMELETRMVRDAKGEWQPNDTGDFQPGAIDLFIINKMGKIQKMSVYNPHPNRWASQK